MPLSSTARVVAKSSFWLTSSYGLAKASQLVSQVLLARLLTPEAFGIWGMVMVITTLSELFKDSAIAQVIVQRGLENKTLTDAVYSLGISISVLMFVVQSLVGYPLSIFFKEPVVWPLTICAALVFLIGAGAGSHGAILARRMQFRELAISDMGAGLARLLGAVICAYLGFGVWAFAIAEVSRAFVDANLKRWFSQYPFHYSLWPELEALHDVWSYISSLIGIDLAVYANTNNMAYQLSMLPAYALSQINRVNLSILSQRDAMGQERYIRKVLEISALFSAPLYGIGFVIAPWLIPLLYGPEWIAVVPLFRIILIFAYSRGFMSILGTTLNALDKPQLNALINWVLVPLAIPAFFFGIWQGGLQGIAIAVALVMGIGAVTWFWVATSHVMKCSCLSLVKPVILPTWSVILAIIITLNLPYKLTSNLVIQMINLLLFYGLLISLFSWGRIPGMAIKIAQKFLRAKK